MDEMADQNARLENLVKRRTEDLFNSRQQLILSLARAAEHRDDDTGNQNLWSLTCILDFFTFD